MDDSAKWGKGHYENPNRFNVATSRARKFTFIIYGAIPLNAQLIKEYLRHFGAWWQDAPADEILQVNPILDRYAWRYKKELLESKFEIEIAGLLNQFSNLNDLKLYNQVTACGQKRLDFVLFNGSNLKFCAVEVDGPSHYCTDGKSFCDAHLERVEILKRGGWQIVHVPYYNWWCKGRLRKTEDLDRKRTEKELFDELSRCLL